VEEGEGSRGWVGWGGTGATTGGTVPRGHGSPRDLPVGHDHSAGRLRKITGGPGRHSVGFKWIQNNPNLIQMHPKLVLI
jgi:hypothetical protein